MQVRDAWMKFRESMASGRPPELDLFALRAPEVGETPIEVLESLLGHGDSGRLQLLDQTVAVVDAK